MIVLPPGDRIRLGQVALPELERSIVQAKEASPITYVYVSLEALLFELGLRSRIVESARALYASGVKFATYTNSRCNEAYWLRTAEGGFRLRSGVASADAIRDIFVNGSLYAFECSMAMVLVVYRAVSEQIPRSAFNTYFNNLYLYDWQYDSDLGFIKGSRMLGAYPGDIFYFKNPDHNPATPEWQGENGIMLGPDQFYGHGVGIRSSSGIIEALNRRRRPGSTVSAYMLDDVVYPNFEHIRSLSGVFARIGSQVYRRKPAV